MSTQQQFPMLNIHYVHNGGRTQDKACQKQHCTQTKEGLRLSSSVQIHSFIHSFHWHAQNVTIPCRSQEILPFLSAISTFPSTLFHKLVFHPPSLELAIYFLVYLSALLFPNSYVILCRVRHWSSGCELYNFWGEFYFISFYMPKPT
jgi:hypothetical protein